MFWPVGVRGLFQTPDPGFVPIIEDGVENACKLLVRCLKRLYLQIQQIPERKIQQVQS